MQEKNILTEEFNSNNYLPLFNNKDIVSGKFEFYRGVIGISKEGQVEKYKLDESPNMHHNIATFAVVSDLGCVLEFSDNGYDLALQAAHSGIVVIQYEAGVGLLYLPDVITERQYESLIECLKIGDYVYEIVHNEKITYNVDENSDNKIDANFVLKYISLFGKINKEQSKNK